VEVEDVLGHGGTVHGARAQRDQRRRAVAGAGRGPGGAGARFPLVGAWNVVVRKRWFGAYGVALESLQAHHDARGAGAARQAQFVFCAVARKAPWWARCTSRSRAIPRTTGPRRAAVQNFLDEINAVYPPARPLRWTMSRLLHVGCSRARGIPGRGFGGAGQAFRSPGARAQGGPRGLLSIKGVKYTTGLEVGERAGRLAALQLGAPSTGKAPVLYGGAAWPSAADVVQAAARHGFALSPAVAERCAAHYGSEVEHVLQEARADGAALVPGDAGVLRAEVRHAVRREHALHVTDVVLRRTDMGTLARPPDEAVRAIAEEMAGLLGWTAEQVADEVARVRSAYPDFSAG
jgi:glycerol-3-phosphate dehydrogenase